MSSSELPVVPRPAATVMLLRDTDNGPEVFLQRRVKAMKFAPSVTVFPGGGLDDRDRSIAADHWHGSPPSWWAQRMGCEPELAAALVCAAVRETFEECGVLLAGGPGGTPLTASPAQLAAARAELVDRRAALPDVLTGNGWVLRADLLRPWSNWITPELEKRRYDTRFFVAELPEGQHADDSTTEVTEAGWRRPVDALNDWRAGDIQLLPPTWVTLEQLTEHADTAAALADGTERVIVPLIPKVRRDGDRLLLTLPGELGYDSDPLSLSPRQLPELTGPATPRAGLLPAEQRPAHPIYQKVRPVTPSASVILAENPSPMTLEGTNTWLLRGPDAESIIVIDPGPLDETHLRLVSEQGPVAQILVTHRHLDHAEGARRLAELTRAPVRALDPTLVLGSEGLDEGDVVAAAGLELRVLATPGHTSDSLCFLLDDAVLTGDTILGRGTTVIDHPDGRLGDYLDSLRRLAELPPGVAVLPGHGPELADAGTVAREYLEHRSQRLDQVRAALATLGPQATARQVVELVYVDVDPVLWPAAEWSVEAQLAYLRS
jgi:glyoxylase-like metal-dependent hydrolase (beta-lactamase superfamily II)/8-oxo-dGTP pyrophosphatase MutT (NUDIX family)